ncbi:DNA cytosine methyltransferase [Saccharopolyspora kobensis]
MNSSPRAGSLCTGYGGLDMAVERVFGAELTWYSDIDPGPIRLLEHHYPTIPNIGDLTTVDWQQLAETMPVDILTAGYPCQPFSVAGKKQGANDDRHIWPHIAEGIRVLRPRIVVLENVANHLRIGFPDVLGDLAALGYHASWGVVRASDAGAPHHRARLFVVAADPNGFRHQWTEKDAETGGGGADLRSEIYLLANPDGEPRVERRPATAGETSSGQPLGEHRGRGGVPSSVEWGKYGPAVERWGRVIGRHAPDPQTTGPRGGKKVAPAFAEWMMGLPVGHVSEVPGLSINQQLKLCGNGVVPQQAELAIRLLLPTLSL